MSDNLKVKHIIEMIEAFQNRIVRGSFLDPSNSFFAFVLEDENGNASILCEVDDYDLYEPNIGVLKIRGRNYNEMLNYTLPTIEGFIEMVKTLDMMEYELCLEDYTNENNIIRHHVKDKGITTMSHIGSNQFLIFRPKPKEYTENENINILQELGGITS